MELQLRFPAEWELHQVKKGIDASLEGVPEAAVRVRLHQPRVLETAVLVAAITGGAKVTAALIQAVCTIVSNKQARKIVVRGQHGGELEFAASASPETVRKITDAVQAVQNPTLSVE